MLYNVRLLLSYDYEHPANAGRCLLRLLPLDLAGEQQLVSARLDVDPGADERWERTDFFGNRVTELAFLQTLRSIRFTLEALVDRKDPVRRAGETPLSEIRRAAASIASMSADSPHHFSAASPLVAPFDAATEFARACTFPAMSTANAVVAIGEALHARMQFNPDATTLATPPEEAFALRAGVCQDFAHVMIAALRGLGVPSGYASGYLRTIAPAGMPRLQGVDAMHAWVRAWCGPEVGWLEYDPTNAQFAGEDHILVGRGRDYSDIAPIIGALRTAGSQESGHAVDVEPVG